MPDSVRVGVSGVPGVERGLDSTSLLMARPESRVAHVREAWDCPRSMGFLREAGDFEIPRSGVDIRSGSVRVKCLRT